MKNRQGLPVLNGRDQLADEFCWIYSHRLTKTSELQENLIAILHLRREENGVLG
jgi:hypothetical protein